MMLSCPLLAAASASAGITCPLCAGAGGRVALAVVLTAVGLWLTLISHAPWLRRGGGFVTLSGFVLMATQLPPLRPWGEVLGFWLLAGLAVGGAMAMIVSRRPLYSAIWFAVSLLGVASLLLWQGAQFLGLATMVVYAGAIVVTFLFVLMLALPEGYARYDRISWGKLPAAGACLLAAGLVGLCVWGFGTRETGIPLATAAPDRSIESSRWQLPKPASAARRADDLLHPAHVARLGAHMFTDYLVAIELAGVLLLMALVGAVSWMAQAQRHWQGGERTAEGTYHV